MNHNIIITSDDSNTISRINCFLSGIKNYNICSNSISNSEYLDVKPDVIFIDINENRYTFDYISKLKALYPTIPIIAIVNPKSTNLIFSSLKVGVSGFFEKYDSKEAFIWTLESILTGGNPMSKTIARQIITSFWVPREPDLSEKENMVFQLLTNKNSYSDIANELSISLNTVKTHIKSIYGKLQVQNKKELANKYTSKVNTNFY